VDLQIDLTKPVQEIIEKSLETSSLTNLLQYLWRYKRNNILISIFDFFVSQSLIYSLLSFISWVMSSQCEFVIFPFQNPANSTKYIKQLEKVLKLSIDINKTYGEDPHKLFPPSLIQNYNVKQDNNILFNQRQKDVKLEEIEKKKIEVLEDQEIVLKLQLELGNKVNLFSTIGDHGNNMRIIGELLGGGEYDRAFAVGRSFGIDMGEACLEATGIIGQRAAVTNDFTILGSFVINVVSRLEKMEKSEKEKESENLLIEALSSFLITDKSSKEFTKILVSGVEEASAAIQMMRWFGGDDSAAILAMTEELVEEVQKTLKISKKKRKDEMTNRCQRWLLEHQCL